MQHIKQQAIKITRGHRTA